jgi:hypothetical protein
MLADALLVGHHSGRSETLGISELVHDRPQLLEVVINSNLEHDLQVLVFLATE